MYSFSQVKFWRTFMYQVVEGAQVTRVPSVVVLTTVVVVVKGLRNIRISTPFSYNEVPPVRPLL